MTPHVFKVSETTQGKVVSTKGFEGNAIKLQGVVYSSQNPSSHLYLYDKDNNIVSFPISGQLDNPKLAELFEVDCMLPLRVVDEESGNSVEIRGLIYRPSLTA